MANFSERAILARRSFESGDLQNAENILRSILSDAPGEPGASLLLGVICTRTGRAQEGGTYLESVIRTVPESYDALLWLAVSRRQESDLTGAAELLQRAIRIRQNDPFAFLELGKCWLGLRDAVQAVNAFTQAVRLAPKVATGYFNLGLALKLNGSSVESFHAFKRATELDPDLLAGYSELFGQMQHLLNWKEGLERLEEGFRGHPESISVSVALAVTYGKLGKSAEAEKIFRDATEKDPMAGPPYAHWLHEQARFKEAERILVRSIGRDPTLGEAYHNLTVAKCFDLDRRPLLDAALEALQLPDLRPEAAMFLLYAVAKAYDAVGRFELAMSYFDRANAAAYSIYNSHFQIEDHGFVEHAQALYPAEKIRELRVHGSASEVPVFIVGMIRSGTTLLDQILARHPSIRSAGEQPFWEMNVPRLEYKWQRSGVDVKDIQAFAEKYLETLEDAAGEAPRIIDKMPVNYHSLGLVNVVFPKARIIHLRRDPMDTCLSIYTTYLGNATFFAYDQGNIVANYRAYLELMDYWRTVVPAEHLLEIDYEQLVTDREPVIREVIEFCGLAWDDACLNEGVNPGQVSTPSLFAARQPVNTNSIGRWRLYEPWLGKLLELRDSKHFSK